MLNTTVTPYQRARADLLRLRLRSLGGRATIDELCASLGWPAHRVIRAVFILRTEADAVALRFNRGQVTEVVLTEASR